MSIISPNTRAAASGTADSTSSTMLKFVSQLPGVRLQSTSSSKGDVDLPPTTNSLFVRNDKDELDTLSKLLRSYFPSSGSSGLNSFPSGGVQLSRTTSSAGLSVGLTIGLTSALHQLASSSALYRSALDELSTRARVKSLTVSSADESSATVDISVSLATTTALAKASDTTHNRTKQDLENYQLDTLSAASQTAIDHAQRASSANESVSQQCDKHGEIDSTNSSARFYRLGRSRFCGTKHNNGNTLTMTRIGALPDISPFLVLQNSLLGGGIQRPAHSKLSVNVDGDKASALLDDSTKGTVIALGSPPPDTSPSFLLQNSLVDKGAFLEDSTTKCPGLDRPGSSKSLISRANETAKDLNSALISESKTHFSLDRLDTSLASEDSGASKSTSMTASRFLASIPDIDSASLNTTQDTVSNGTVDLGLPPNGPPAFTIGNSLIGGGIKLQPAAANVNTHNSDWKLYRATSNTSEDAISSPEVTRDISHGLQPRLERLLVSSQSTADKA